MSFTTLSLIKGLQTNVLRVTGGAILGLPFHDDLWVCGSFVATILSFILAHKRPIIVFSRLYDIRERLNKNAPEKKIVFHRLQVASHEICSRKRKK